MDPLVQEAGTKFDGEKTRYELVPRGAEAGVADVYTYGAKKYGDRNWQQGIHVSRLYAALRRHTEALIAGEDIDPESGRPHWFHAECCIQMIGWMIINKPEFDDRKEMV